MSFVRRLSVRFDYCSRLVDLFSGIADAVLNPKKKVWETVAPDLKVSSTGVATYRGEQLIVDGGKGVITAPTLRDVAIK